MHAHRIANPDTFRPTRPLTIGDVARTLDLTPEGVREVVRRGELACTFTLAGMRLFLAADVLRLAIARAEHKLSHTLQIHKPLGSHADPYQPSLFGAQLRIVRAQPEKAKPRLEIPQAKVSRSLKESR